MRVDICSGESALTNFILIGIFVLMGALFRRLKAFPEQTAHVLNMFALYVSLPAVILLKVPELSISAETVVAAIVPWCMLLLSALLVLTLARSREWTRATTGVLLLVVPIGNTSFMGVPMVRAFFGEAGLPHLILYDQIGTMLIFATYGAVILSLYSGERSDLPTIIKRALLFPPTTALLIGLALRNWSYPQVVVNTLHDLGGALTALVMTAIGFQMKFRLQRTTLEPLAVGLAIKLMIAPLVALAACRLLGLDSLAADISIFEAGMPPMVTACALAAAAGIGVELAVAMAGLGILLAFVSLPLVYLLIQVL
jgi:predicted permease